MSLTRMESDSADGRPVRRELPVNFQVQLSYHSAGSPSVLYRVLVQYYDTLGLAGSSILQYCRISTQAGLLPVPVVLLSTQMYSCTA